MATGEASLEYPALSVLLSGVSSTYNQYKGDIVIIKLEVEVEKAEGKFVSRDEIGEELLGMLDGDIYVEDSVYSVTDSSVVS